MKKSPIGKLFLLFWSGCLLVSAQAGESQVWSDTDISLLRLHWIGSLPKLQQDPTNKYAENPAAAKFGQKL